MRRTISKFLHVMLALTLTGAVVSIAAAPASAAGTVTVRRGDTSPGACIPYSTWYSSDDVGVARAT